MAIVVAVCDWVFHLSAWLIWTIAVLIVLGTIMGWMRDGASRAARARPKI